jgi:hypothetical protein
VYKNSIDLELFLGAVNVVDLVEDLLIKKKTASLVVLKLPLNYNFARLRQVVSKEASITIDVMPIHRRGVRKYDVWFVANSSRSSSSRR